MDTKKVQRLRLVVAGLPINHVVRTLGSSLDAMEASRAGDVAMYTGQTDTTFGGAFIEPRERASFMRLIQKDYEATMDDLIGAAFVVCQTYLTRVSEAVIDMAPAFVPRRNARQGLMGLGSPKVRKVGARVVTEIECVNAIANWWKHRDQWPPPPWPPRGRHQPTASIVHMLGVRSNVVGQALLAAQRLGVTPENLNVLLAKLRSWGGSLLLRVEQEQIATTGHRAAPRPR